MSKSNRIGDHIWYISDLRKFNKYPRWKMKYNLNKIIAEIVKEQTKKK